MRAHAIPKIKFPASATPVDADIPPLNPGDHLSRAEFHRRYQAHPEIKKAELIEGVVYMPSPIRFTKHSEPHGWIVGWLVAYVAATPKTRLGDNASVRLDWENEAQPDAFLMLEPARGGNVEIAPDDYLDGAPELVIEVAASSVAYDLHSKKRVYQRNGVQEYLVLQPRERRQDWFVLRGGVYETLSANEDGVITSQVFPGLWLNVSAFWEGDLAALLATLQNGIASPEHGTFVEKFKM